MSCNEVLVKYVLYATILVFKLTGFALMGVGIFATFRMAKVADIAETNITWYTYFATFVGWLASHVGVLGFYATYKEKRRMLIGFSVGAFVVIIIKIAWAVVIFINLDYFLKEMPRWLFAAFARDPTKFQEIENSFTCCGPNGAQSYGSSAIPNSCCATAPCTTNNSYPGCGTIVPDVFNSVWLAMALIPLSVVVVDLVAAVFGLLQANNLKNKSRRAQYS